MEWNCYWNVNTMSSFLIESTGDSEDVKSDVHHHPHPHREEDEAVMDESEGISYRFDDEDDVNGDDDAQSCSYDHLSYINTKHGENEHDQSQGVIYDDDEDGNVDDGDMDVNDDKNKNCGESKLLDSCKKQKRSHKLCVDSSNQREIDRKFWEACLAN